MADGPSEGKQTQWNQGCFGLQKKQQRFYLRAVSIWIHPGYRSPWRIHHLGGGRVKTRAFSASDSLHQFRRGEQSFTPQQWDTWNSEKQRKEWATDWSTFEKSIIFVVKTWSESKPCAECRLISFFFAATKRAAWKLPEPGPTSRQQIQRWRSVDYCRL